VPAGLASVTVLHAQCMQADALATVLTVLGAEEGFVFAEARGIAALFVAHATQGDEAPSLRATPAWTERTASA